MFVLKVTGKTILIFDLVMNTAENLFWSARENQVLKIFVLDKNSVE